MWGRAPALRCVLSSPGYATDARPLDSPSFAAPLRACGLPPVAGLRARSPEDDHLDYAEVGLMCGLEVHQQLLTERKLFCRCPAGRYTEDPRRRRCCATCGRRSPSSASTTAPR